MSKPEKSQNFEETNLALELKDVSVSFDGTSVLKNISLQIPKAKSLVLLGPSGQGKTVLLKILAGLIPPTSGKLFIQGQDFHSQPRIRRQMILKDMGMLFQKNALFDSLTCGQNIAFPLQETTTMDSLEIENKVDFYLDAVGIPHAKYLFPDEISGGMQKRLGIARALALNPKIIFYDDPTAGLDPITSRKIIDLIIDLKNKNGTTVVTITNEVNRAYQLADSIGMVVDQELLWLNSVEVAKRSSDPRVKQFLSGSVEGPLMALS